MASSLGVFASLGKTWVGSFHGCIFVFLTLSLVGYNPCGFSSSMYVFGFRDFHALVV